MTNRSKPSIRQSRRANSVLKAVRRKCLDCSGGSTAEVRLCILVDCPLWPFRFGRRPNTVAAKRPELMDRGYVLSHKGRDEPGTETPAGPEDSAQEAVSGKEDLADPDHLRRTKEAEPPSQRTVFVTECDRTGSARRA